ncbi:alpha-galactosidase [Lacticaseibacillus chiayiensis]|uniref:Alpha-galactosidase n=1 Tax=Lacticaseibacillus chiayiensis TaxID=2100821 RepID=A0ABY6H4N3_9LACO|nr:glycoside hydrolase family 36 protein [Lacticaseibacillus chiayiensis]UYN56294.1 alpha-galactosidase [Lacticaseibacillus chiayiensis]
MVNFSTLSTFTFDDMVLHYIIDEDGHVEWMIYPQEKKDLVKLPDHQRTPISLVQAKLAGDAYDKNFSNGMTMYNSETARHLTFVGQNKNADQRVTQIRTNLKDQHGNLYTHVVEWQTGSQRLKCWAEFTNQTQTTVKLDYLSSFTLNGVTPFYKRIPAGTLDLIRFRSKWSMEGRLEQQPIEMYDLEPSWKPSGLALEQFGQNGTMPVRRFFPTIGMADKHNNVIWLATFDARASWQLNAARLDDRLVLFGGLPDADNGQWYKLVAPQTTYRTPSTYMTVAAGDLTQTSRRLQQIPSAKSALPIVYNEWGTTWGHPSASLVSESLSLLADHAVDYYVIDAGWYHSPTDDFNAGLGDWQIDQERFPQGLTPVVKAIHQHGMKAGIWYEFEGLGPDSHKYNDTAALVKRDGWPVTTMKRRFLDMTSVEVQNHLEEKMIRPVTDAGFEYLKVDYNDSIGIGADGADSPAEGLQAQETATLAMFKKIHERVPGIVIENCSSGGHRLTPAFIENTELSSFSDAHETHSIPIIAANELQILPAAKNLIWCVVHPDDQLHELQFHLIATFLGRICMSGDIRKLSQEQWQTIDTGFAFYHQCNRLIATGFPFRRGPKILSYANPVGYQISGFCDGKTLEESHQVLVLVFGFNQETAQTMSLDMDATKWQLTDEFGAENLTVHNSKKAYHVTIPSHQFVAKALLFTLKD